jgi:hypothetical protein
MGWMREETGSYAAGVGWLCVPCVLGAGVMLFLLRSRVVQGEAGVSGRE